MNNACDMSMILNAYCILYIVRKKPYYGCSYEVY